ncbi:hypothetical protein K469DRAFT_665053 [Zopfia rhizophila CBS 207.26]|uniref:Zf-CHY-domain-containing protein n=1 Tax=Zopfia rhizophila CBS 207.26 TaxID=1314779 RepID=A0A6A6E5L3_9PEZI|nr:hypothetical protein K469DRAFT_665053 [Zopfia rhizophila CBS 207.26]
MSTLISSFIIDPVVRQARRFSGAVPQLEGGEGDSRRLSHVNPSSPPTPALAAPLGRDVQVAIPALDEDHPQIPDAHSTALIDRFRGHTTFIRRPRSVVGDGEEAGMGENDSTAHDASLSLSRSQPTTPSAPIGIPQADLDMSQNRDHSLETQFRRLDLDAPPSTTVDVANSLQSRSRAGSAAAGQNVVSMLESLPADDGMAHLRARIHQIWGMKSSNEEKARMMHSLMTERYNLLRPQSPNSFISNDRPFTPTSGQSIFSDVQVSSPISTASEVDPENPFNLRPEDTNPSFRIRSLNPNTDNTGEDEDFDTAEDGSSLGCQHYKRNVKVQCFQCRRWYTCRHCHDAVEDHNLNRRKTQNMLCMVCGTPQKAGEYCTQCGTQAACYYCDICKLWDDNSIKKIYHCIDCGICRRGEGLGKDYIHCKKCNVCIAIAFATSHKCLERATDCDCPICGEYLFNSSSAVVSMPCGHYLHKGCYNLYMETAYKCPMCKKSAVNMELQWRKLTHAIESQPMPEQFANTRAVIQCNDCSAKCSVKYHWLGNKCSTCDSYNTNEMRILNGPESEETANALLSGEENSGARSPASAASASSPSSQPLRSPRYYFQPDQPEETWIPDQLTSFPFQMPQFRGMPGMPQMPTIPQFRGMPQLPPLPQMPDPYELMERVSRSFSAYLNPSGDVADENVPIIDLGEERPEGQATDGSTVRQPSLPQYVLERFSRSLSPLRNYLNPSIENIPRLDLTEEEGDEQGLEFWGTDGGKLDRFLSGGEEESESESESEESESMEEEEEDEGEGGDDNDIELPGHR